MRLLLLLLAVITFVNASSLIPRAKQGLFQLTNFYFGGAPHSVQISYQFDVTDGNLSTRCFTYNTIVPGLYPFNLTACQNPKYSFSWTYTNKTKPESGYYLEVTEQINPARKNHTACQLFPASKVQYVQNPANPNGNFYRLDAPFAFNMTWKKTNKSCA